MSHTGFQQALQSNPSTLFWDISLFEVKMLQFWLQRGKKKQSSKDEFQSQAHMWDYVSKIRAEGEVRRRGHGEGWHWNFAGQLAWQLAVTQILRGVTHCSTPGARTSKHAPSLIWGSPQFSFVAQSRPLPVFSSFCPWGVSLRSVERPLLKKNAQAKPLALKASEKFGTHPLEGHTYLQPLAVQKPSVLLLLWDLQEPWKFPGWWQCQDPAIPMPPCCPLKGTLHLSCG